jgi:hypothetical protein
MSNFDKMRYLLDNEFSNCCLNFSGVRLNEILIENKWIEEEGELEFFKFMASLLYGVPKVVKINRAKKSIDEIFDEYD